MTRKDYELIANAINDCVYPGAGDYNTVRLVARKVADELAEDNPRFDRNKFLGACGVDSPSGDE